MNKKFKAIRDNVGIVFLGVLCIAMFILIIAAGCVGNINVNGRSVDRDRTHPTHPTHPTHGTFSSKYL